MPHRPERANATTATAGASGTAVYSPRMGSAPPTNTLVGNASNVSPHGRIIQHLGAPPSLSHHSTLFTNAAGIVTPIAKTIAPGQQVNAPRPIWSTGGASNTTGIHRGVPAPLLSKKVLIVPIDPRELTSHKTKSQPSQPWQLKLTKWKDARQQQLPSFWFPLNQL